MFKLKNFILLIFLDLIKIYLIRIILKKFSKIFSYLSDTNRFKIYSLLLLYKNGLFVCEICKVLNLPYYTVLKKLKELELIELIYSERNGKFILYLPNNTGEELLIKLNSLILDISEKTNIFDFNKISEILKNRKELKCFCSKILQKNKKIKNINRKKIKN